MGMEDHRALKDRIQMVMSSLAEVVACRWCGTRIRFGDFECPHCGADLEDDLYQWAERLVARLIM